MHIATAVARIDLSIAGIWLQAGRLTTQPRPCCTIVEHVLHGASMDRGHRSQTIDGSQLHAIRREPLTTERHFLCVCTQEDRTPCMNQCFGKKIHIALRSFAEIFRRG